MPLPKNLVCFVSAPSSVSGNLTCHCFMQCVPNKKKYILLFTSGFNFVYGGFNVKFVYDFRKIIALSALRELGFGFSLLHFTVFNPCLI